MNSPQLGPYMTWGQAAIVGNYKFEFPRDWGTEGGSFVQERGGGGGERYGTVLRSGSLNFHHQFLVRILAWLLKLVF